MKNLISLLKTKKALLTLLILFILASAYFLYNTYKTKNTNQTQKTITQPAEKGTIQAYVEASGTVQTTNYFPVTTSVSGSVSKLYVAEGDTVKKGDKIMDITLDPESEKTRSSAYASYLQSLTSLNDVKASLAVLEATTQEKEDSFKTVKKTTSYNTEEEKLAFKQAESAFLKAQSDESNYTTKLQQAQISANNAWTNYQLLSPTITAPVDGTVTNILAVEGMQVENSVSEKSIQTVAYVKQQGTPIVQVNVTEIDINSIKIGQTVELTLNSITNKPLSAKVIAIDKVGTSQSGVANYPVTIKLDKESEKVLPNMNVDAKIITEQKDNVVYVPISAVKTMRNKSTVTIDQNGNQTEKEVTTGLSNGENIEITSGLSEGDTVVLSTYSTSGFTNSSTRQFNSFSGTGLRRF